MEEEGARWPHRSSKPAWRLILSPEGSTPSPLRRHIDRRGCRRAEPSDRIPDRLARHSAEGIEDAAAPRVYRIARLQELGRADAARELEAAEHDVIGIVRLVAAEIRLRLKRFTDRIDRFSERLDPLRTGDKRLELRSETRLAGSAEVILIFFVDALVDVEHGDRNDRHQHHGVRPE